MNKINRHDSDEYWPTSIKYTIKGIPFLTFMEYTANIMKTNKQLISSLLRLFAMFELCLLSGEEKLDVIAIRCINCRIETGLFLKNTTFEEMITNFC